MSGTTKSRLTKLKEKFVDKTYRDAYVSAHVRRWIANQIRALRADKTRSWTQADLAARMGKPQSVVSRLEDPDYGKMTVNTLLEVAAAFDVALEVKFVAHEQFVRDTEDVSERAMAAPSFADTVWSAPLPPPAANKFGIVLPVDVEVHPHSTWSWSVPQALPAVDHRRIVPPHHAQVNPHHTWSVWTSTYEFKAPNLPRRQGVDFYVLTVDTNILRKPILAGVR